MDFISIVIPIHNEEENIKNLIYEIIDVMGTCNYEIVAVNDGSSDRTEMVIKKLVQNNSNIKLITHLENYGQSAAVYSGIEAASGNIIATIDGDGQNNPEDIILLTQELLKNQDSQVKMAVGFRHQRQDSRVKIFSSKIANLIRSSLLEDQANDSGCGLKVFYKESFQNLPFFNHMHRFLPALFSIYGFSILNVKVSHRERKKGTSHYGTIDRLIAGLFDLAGVWWFKKRQIKIKIRSNY